LKYLYEIEKKKLKFEKLQNPENFYKNFVVFPRLQYFGVSSAPISSVSMN